MKKYKNIIFVFIFILLCIIVFTYNFLLNPYDIKQYSKHNFDIIHSPAHLISVALKQSKEIKYKNVILAGSLSHPLFLTDLFLCKTHEPIARLIVPGYSAEKLYEMLKYFLDMHPEVENVYVSLENYTYIKCDNFDDCDIKNTSKLKDIVNLYFSADVTKLSLDKVRNKYFEQRQKTNEDVEKNSNDYFLVYPKRKFVTDYNKDCLTENIKSLQKIRDLLDSRKINSTFFIPPANALYLAELYTSNHLEKIENLKRAYSDVVPFYDMAFINKYTSMPIGVIWRDVLHINSFLNIEVYNLLVDKDNSSNIAMYVDKENIDLVLEKEKNLIISFIENNKSYVDDYIKNSYWAFDIPDVKTEKVYFDSIPKKYTAVHYCPMQKVHQIEEELGL